MARPVNAPLPLPRPLLFLAFFGLAALALLPLWQVLSGGFMATLVQTVNGLSRQTGLPAGFQLPPWSHTRMVLPGLAAGAALFLVTPGRSLRWRFVWIGVLVLAVFLTETAILYTQVRLAYIEHLRLHPPAPDQTQGLARPGQLAAICGYLAGLGERWSDAVLPPLLWFTATRLPR